MRGTEHGWLTYAVTLVSAAVFAFTELHPLLLLFAGAALVVIAGG
jgi:hypothetical protein